MRFELVLRTFLFWNVWKGLVINEVSYRFYVENCVISTGNYKSCTILLFKSTGFKFSEPFECEENLCHLWEEKMVWALYGKVDYKWLN